MVFIILHLSLKWLVYISFNGESHVFTLFCSCILCHSDFLAKMFAPVNVTFSKVCIFVRATLSGIHAHVVGAILKWRGIFSILWISELFANYYLDSGLCLRYKKEDKHGFLGWKSLPFEAGLYLKWYFCSTYINFIITFFYIKHGSSCVLKFVVILRF